MDIQDTQDKYFGIAVGIAIGVEDNSNVFTTDFMDFKDFTD